MQIIKEINYPMKYVIIKKEKRESLYKLYKAYLHYRKYVESCMIPCRNPNFPSEISELMVCSILWKTKKIKSIYETTSGDLMTYNNEIIEVKCFSSTGPISFGPNHNWKYLCLVDATKLNENYFEIYFIDLKKNSEQWSSIKINNTLTFKDYCDTGKRPRINPEQLFVALKEINHEPEKIYSGNIENALLI